MFRRLATETCLICCFVAWKSAFAVEFVVGDAADAARQAAADTPVETYPDPMTTLDELPGVPGPPADLTPPPAIDHYDAPPIDSSPAVVGSGSLPHGAESSPLPDSFEGATDWGAPLYDDSNSLIPDNSCCPSFCDSGCRCLKHRTWFIDFWLAQGVSWNYDNPRNNSNLPMTFNDRANEYQLNQLYLSFGRRVRETGSCWDWGGQADLLFGTDYFFTQALGLETRNDGSPRWNSGNGPRGAGAALYGLAMPQLFAEFYAPVLRGINVKIGHFYTTVGYESVMAPENFFYSHAYTMQYGEPFTHTGALASFGISRCLNGHFGYTRGWDTWEDPNGKPGYLMGLSWTPTDVASLAATVHTGREDLAGRNDRTICSIVYTRQISSTLRYVLQHDFGMEANGEVDSSFSTDSAKWYGLNQYLFLDVNERLTAGLRFEWFRDQDNARVLGIPFESAVEGGNYSEVTLGMNWRATNRILVRPELRYDYSDVFVPGATRGMYDDFSDDNQFTASTDVIFRF